MADETRTDACQAESSGPRPVTPSRRVGDLNWMSVVSILAIFAIFDFLYFPVFQAVAPRPSFTAIAVYIFVFFGSIVAQSVVLSVWATCGRLPQLLRFIVWPVVAVFLCGGAIMGGRLTEPSPFATQNVFPICLCMPFLLLAAQIPVAVFWFFLGRRVPTVPTQEQPVSGPTRQFTLFQMLGLTTYVALAFGLVNVYMNLLENTPAPQSWLVWLMAGGLTAVVNLVFGIPVLWAVFVARNKQRAGVIVLALAALPGLAIVGLITVMSQSPPPGEMVLAYGGAGMLASAIALGVLHVTFKKHEPQDGPRREPLAMATQEAVSTSPADTDLFSS